MKTDSGMHANYHTDTHIVTHTHTRTVAFLCPVYITAGGMSKFACIWGEPLQGASFCGKEAFPYQPEAEELENICQRTSAAARCALRFNE